MAENFSDAKKIKQKRQSFMGGVREVKQALPPARPKAEEIKPEVKEAPPVQAVTEPTKVEAENKMTVSKGFIVGYTEDGLVVFKHFGDISKMEVVGLVEYVKVISKDIIEDLAQSSTSMIKKGVQTTLTALKTMMPGADKAAA